MLEGVAGADDDMMSRLLSLLWFAHTLNPHRGFTGV